MRINCRESKIRAQHLCQEVLAEDLSIRLRGWKGATLIKLFDRVGRGILLTHAGRTFLSEARAVLARVRTIKPVLDRLSHAPGDSRQEVSCQCVVTDSRA